MIDANKINLKKELAELKNLSGQERGEDFKYLVNYVKDNKGEASFRKIVDKLNKLGYQLPETEKIDQMEWIPVSLVNIFFVACVKEFKWQESDIIKLGQGAITFKYLTKLYIKYFHSTKKTINQAADGWRNHYSFGDLKIVEFNQEKGRVVLRLEKFKVHYFTYIYFAGIFSKLLEMATGKKINFKNIKYSLVENGCEYTFNWQP